MEQQHLDKFMRGTHLAQEAVKEAADAMLRPACGKVFDKAEAREWNSLSEIGAQISEARDHAMQLHP